MSFPVKSDKRLGEILVEQGHISPVQIHRVLKKQAEMKKTKGYQIRLGELLLTEKLVDEVALAKAVGEQWGIDFLDLCDVEVDLDDYASIPFDLVKKLAFVPIKRGAVDLTVAIDEDPDEELYHTLDASRSGDVTFVSSPRGQIKKLVEMVREHWNAGKPLTGTISLDAAPGSRPEVQQAVAAISDDEPLTGAHRFRAQRTFGATERVVLDAGIEDITDLDMTLPAPDPVEEDDLQLSSGDALDEILPRLRDEGKLPSSVIDSKLDARQSTPDVLPAKQENEPIPIPDPLALIPDDLAFGDGEVSLHDDVESARNASKVDDEVKAGSNDKALPAGAAVQPAADPEPVQLPESRPEPAVVPRPEVPAREEVNEPMAIDQPAAPQQRRSDHRKMNAVLKEMLLRAVTQSSLGMTFVLRTRDVAAYAKNLEGTSELGSLSFDDYNDIIAYLGQILKADLSSLEQPLKRKIKLKIGDNTHLFQFLFAPTRPLSLNINILDESLVRYSLDTVGLEGAVRDKLKGALTRDFGLTILSSPNIDDVEDLYFSILSFLSKRNRKVISFESEVKYRIPGLSRYSIGRGNGVSADTVFSPASLRTFLDGGYDSLACNFTPPAAKLKNLVNVALSEINTIVTVPAKDCLSSFMVVKKTGISTSSLIEACLFLINVRKVHKVCPFCKETFLITQDLLPPQLAQSRQLLDLKAYRGKGCDQCKGSGVAGTTLLFETMEVDSDRINIDELTRKKKPLKTHLLETRLLRPLSLRARRALMSGRITLKEFLEILGG